MSSGPARLSLAHQRRLREVWRSAGWPYHDLIEIDLLAAGLLARECDAAGRETVRVTDAGIHQLAETLQKNRAARNTMKTWWPGWCARCCAPAGWSGGA